jgi:hypothetical protein
VGSEGRDLAGLSVRKIAEDAVAVTIGWPRTIGQWGYVPTIDGSEILTDGKRHIGKSATKQSVKIGKRRDGKSHRYGVKLLMTGQAGEVIGTASPPPDPTPPPSADVSLAQSWLILGQEPMDALNAPSYYKLAVTADLGYRHWYDAAFFTQAHGRVIVPWCDCQVPSGYHPGEGTGPDVAIQFMHDLGAPYWMGQAEAPEQFDNAMAADVKPRLIIGDIAHMRDDQIARVKAREVLWVNEAYRNCSGIMDPGWPDWKNANAGIGGNCIAVYEEGPCHLMPVRDYLARGLYVAHRDSAYGPQMTVADYKALP